MIVDCVSDLHGHYPKLEGGDLLIVAGDLTAKDDLRGWVDWVVWIQRQRYKKKIVVGGNHDGWLFNTPPQIDTWGHEIAYLCDSGTEFEGLKIWGSPWTKRFEGMNPDCMAFTVDTDEELAEKWALIPKDTNILITHSPPKGILDTLAGRGHHAGSVSLFNRLETIKPMLHVFGHIHEAYGESFHNYKVFCGEKAIHLVNASHVNLYYEPVNKPIRVILKSET